MIIEKSDDLGKALKNDENTIEIEGDLARRVIKIKATGKVAWGICFGSIAIAVTAILLAPTTAGTSTGFAAVNGLIGSSILGVGGMTAAISIAVAAGGVGALNKLRSYKLKRISENHIILTKK